MMIPIICAVTAGTAAVFSVASFCVLKSRKKRSGGRSDADMDTVVRGLRENPEAYEGLYESLYLAATGSQTDLEAYGEWCERAKMSGDEAFASAFTSVFTLSDPDDGALVKQRLNLLLKAVGEAGVRRDAETGELRICSAEDTAKYQSANGAVMEGKRYRIMKPAWVSGTKTIEPGLAAPES